MNPARALLFAFLLKPDMAGIYIHVPFCRKACTYCNFHFSTSLKNVETYQAALLREITLQKDFFAPNTAINSVYWGGGTPSILSASAIDEIWNHLHKYFQLSPDAEVTLEANPDDLSPTYLQALAQTPVNRLSIGVQSFRDNDLQLMNRSHSALQAIESLENAQKFGFKNLSIDLIYGLPQMDSRQWQQQLDRLKEFDIPHFSAYALTVEPKTVLAHQIKTGKQPPVEEDQAAEHFALLQKFAHEQAYEHYEISNLAKAGHQAKHNSAYWQQLPYLGLGPAAHSYRPPYRRWNVASNALYIKALQNAKIPYEQEELTLTDVYNEYVMTRLRLRDGVDKRYIENHFSAEIRKHWHKETKRLEQNDKLKQNGNYMYIPEKKMFMSDGIAEQLFYVK